jgi:recombination protein RecR
MISAEFNQVISLISRLPGLGPRSARRLLLHFLKRKHDVLHPLVQGLIDIDQKTVSCSVCHNWDTSDPCTICKDESRDPSTICVVADIADIWALERAHIVKGRYHVLGGLLSAIDGVMPSHLTVESLIKRVEGGNIQEIVLALNLTVEGQTTLHYVADLIRHHPIRISTLAHGVPVGGELDYLDDGTLHTAFKARRAV